MKRLLIIGCSDIACRTLPLLRDIYRIYGLVRDSDEAEAVRRLGIIPIVGLKNATVCSALAGFYR